ncbi:MAG: matrixin family metalloprotease [Planctomycetales bacterium]|nr:matrixin family metalloprotease [Planctomycetales bacterium]
MARRLVLTAFVGNSPRAIFRHAVRCALAVTLCIAIPVVAHGFVPAGRWSVDASGRPTLPGKPTSLTWSLVPDGTPIAGEVGSELIGLLDDAFDVGAADRIGSYEGRPWFPVVASCFDRWSELGGLKLTYEPRDDGADVPASAGQTVVRGDIRLAATGLDGLGGLLAATQLPTTSDITLDSGDRMRFADASSSHLRLRNVLAHEIGHAIGLSHVASDDAAILMEPQLQLGIDGPQIDDVRGLHFYYGDRFERSGAFEDNDSLAHATPLGALSLGGMLRVGLDAVDGGPLAPGQIDLVSISRRSDVDFYAIDAPAHSRLELFLTPLGGSYRQASGDGPQLLGDASAASDLAFTVWSDAGVPLVTIDHGRRGESEWLDDFASLASQRLYVSVSGTAENVQLYQLTIRALAIPEPSHMTLAFCVLIASGARRRSAVR